MNDIADQARQAIADEGRRVGVVDPLGDALGQVWARWPE